MRIAALALLAVVAGFVLAPAPAIAGNQHGAPSSYVLLWGTPDVNWDQCQPITYSVSGPVTPKLLDRALAMTAKATGIPFVLAAPGVEPMLRIEFYAMVTGDPTGQLASIGHNGGSAIAYASPLTSAVDDRGDQHWTSARMVVDRFGLTYGFVGTARKAVLMHELGHVMGLDHTSDPEQVMWSGDLKTHRATWGAGDMAGFRALYPVDGCAPVLPDPVAPEPVQPEPVVPDPVLPSNPPEVG
jgi:hypothetical protein